MKTFSQFMYESGGSPYQPYKPTPQPEPSAPPGWKEKYLEPLKKKPDTKLAMKEDAGSGRSADYVRERIRRRNNIPFPTQLDKERKLAYMLQKDLPPPKNKSIF